MKNLILLTFFLSISTYSNEISFFLNIPYFTPENSEFYLTGNRAVGCNWEEKCHQLKRINKSTYLIKLNIQHPEFAEYKITRGSWDNQITGSTHEIYKNQRIRENSKSIYINAINYLDTNKHGVNNTIINHKLYSKYLNRTISFKINIPSNYTNSKRYPVLYAHDGQNLYDPKTNSFGNEWLLDEISNDLIKRNKIREFISVGIDSDGDRNDTYTYSKNGKNYALFITKELKPYIDKNFSTYTDRDNTYLMGSSMGALISFTILWNHSDIFSKAYCLSFPAFAYDNQTFRFLDNNPQPKNTNIEVFLDHGGIGQDKKYSKSVKRFIKKLEEQHSFYSYQYKVYPYADHTEPDWARRLPDVLNMLFEK